MEQRSAIKFCVRNGISAAETLRMCQKAYGDGALSQARVFAWHRMFKEGRESVQDEPRAGRPSTSTDVIHVQKIRDLVLENRRLTVRDLTDLVGISEGSVKTILSDHLGLRKVKARLVPKSLNFLEKQRRVDVSETMLSDYQNRMKNIITGDETPPYSPDLASDFWLFSKLKRPLRGHRFETIEEIKEKTTSELRAIPTDDYAACFENWKKRWHSCIATGGDYFEGDDTNVDE
ncbi:FLJ37770-like protein [Acromyrmex echinatior]|uniref:FLJ37770-like protein n=1 Tax=Acromyrmex echinatior TaxID=103372 RepID=F4X034_ACREC|nr:FLJ37770-like protein [Acromyrmex echinatior]